MIYTEIDQVQLCNALYKKGNSKEEIRYYDELSRMSDNLSSSLLQCEL